MISKNKHTGQQVNWQKFQAEWGMVAFATLMVFLLRAAYVQWLHPYSLAPDEAQYWSWLAHNDWSFLTKPPLTTWLIGVSTWVLGDTLLGVKLFALVGQSLSALLGFAIAKRLGGKVAGLWAWAILTTVPLLAAGGLIMSPDAVLVPLWLGAVYSVVKALDADKSEAEALCWTRWLGIGALIGLGGLAKYSAGLFFPLLGLYLLVWRREWLLKPQVWVSGLVALAFQLPVLIWNMQHGWVGISHVLWQADGGGDGRHGGVNSVLDFVGGQALVVGPVVFGLMLVALGRGLQDYRVTGLQAAVRWLVLVSGAVLGLFGVMAWGAKIQANWPVLGTVVGLVVLAVWLGQVRQRWVMGIAVAGIVLNAGLSVVLMDTYKARDLGLLPLKAKNDPTKDLRGWDEMGSLLGLLMYKLDKPVILSSRYQTLAPLMFHTVGNPEFAYMNAEGKRLNEYDLWPMPDLNNRLVVYVNEQGYLPPKVSGMFAQCEPWHVLGTEEYGTQTRKLSLWLCWNGGRTVAMR